MEEFPRTGEPNTPNPYMVAALPEGVKLSEQQQFIRSILEAAPEGLTAKEVEIQAQKLLGFNDDGTPRISHGPVTARLDELYKAGLVIKQGSRPNPSGKLAEVYLASVTAPRVDQTQREELGNALAILLHIIKVAGTPDFEGACQQAIEFAKERGPALKAYLDWCERVTEQELGG